MGGYNNIINKFIPWAESSDKVQAAVIFGSQARYEKKSDDYSDIDMLMIVDKPGHFLSDSEWLKHIGNVHISFAENTFAGGKERRVLFDGAFDADFIFLTADIFNDPEKMSQIMLMLSRGYSIIVDKINLEQKLSQLPEHNTGYQLPSEDEFLNIINDFWFHSVWTTKKLLRGELWAAKSCIDNYMKRKLLSMIEVHAHAINGKEYNTWHNGRFLDEWADDSVKSRLPYVFAHYDKSDVIKALKNTMDLFRTISKEASDRVGYMYPVEADEYATEWVDNMLGNF